VLPRLAHPTAQLFAASEVIKPRGQFEDFDKRDELFNKFQRNTKTPRNNYEGLHVVF